MSPKTNMRLLYGLERLPEGLAVDDVRLPGVVLDAAPLRVNSEPLPPAFFPPNDNHAMRVAALAGWLNAACGDYAPLRRRFVALYLSYVAAHLDRHRDVLADRLRRFDGLYRVEDFFWSALRPLPRAFVPAGQSSVLVDFAFWDGRQLVVVMVGEAAIADALRTCDCVICRIPANELAGDPEKVIEKYLPTSFREFWKAEVLPMSPFRRAIAN
jgi:hypothetical protein